MTDSIDGHFRLYRRTFLQTLAVAGTSAWRSASAGISVQDDTEVDIPVAGKDRRLKVHGAEIAVLETPPSLLIGQRITPLDRLFVRNNQRLAGSSTLAPFGDDVVDNWSIQLGGLVDGKTIRVGDLESMPQVETEMVLQCSGNGRSIFSQTAQTKGTQWTRGGMGNVQVGGVRLSHVLEKLNVDIPAQVKYVTAAGKDSPTPEKDDFEHSLPISDVLERSILALRFNGLPIPAVHGGPVRLMTPGFYGTMHIKWLTGLRFEAVETDNHNQIPRYRTPRRPIRPGSQLDYTFANSKASWAMKVKSVVLSPAPGAELTAGGRTRVRGVAFNDGSSSIESVVVSVNRGGTWERARLVPPQDVYGWYQWSFDLTFPPGQHEIWSRAIDQQGRSQPFDGSVAWNPSGYEWNGIERIPVRVV